MIEFGCYRFTKEIEDIIFTGISINKNDGEYIFFNITF